MVQTPNEMNAGRKRQLQPNPDTLDGNASMSGAAVSQPNDPIDDFNANMSGAAQDPNSPNTRVDPNITKSTGGVRPRTSGTRYKVS